MKTSRTRQSVTGLAIAVAITLTLLGGIVLALAEGQSAISERPTPTVYHIPTLLPSGQPARVTASARPPTVVVIPTSKPASTKSMPAVTPSPTPAPSQTIRAGSCEAPSAWQTYRIKHGDTLYEIAYRYGITLAALMNANCLGGSDIVTATIIYVPAVTPRPFPNATAGTNSLTAPPPTGTQTATDGACSNPDSAITTPKVGAVLSGNVRIIGTARVPNFAFYKIEIRQEGTGQPYANLYTGHQEVAHGLLAELDTTILPRGEYWLRLVVVDASSNYPERCAILVTLTH